ncbi:hypothetical protein [Streptomyces sp. NBC_01304]|uniref:hypothetical protein n=1 Tax=Streptomyces sp. NBC_01304 TaxID=2903818 RepID=UPI002E0E8EF1|nr:hypothetical protein OG430_22525 [Streptomyces sp. NBC_01304]
MSVDDDSRTPLEQHLAEALRETGDTFRPDTLALTQAGHTRGRRLRYRRRAAITGGVAAIAAVGVGGALLVPGALDGGDRSPAAGPAASSRSAATAKTPAPGAREVAKVFKSLLPQGKFKLESARGSADELGPMASGVFDDGHGKAAMGISFSRIDPDSEQAREMTECPDNTLVEYDFCSSKTLPDGSQLMLFKGYEYPDRRVDTKNWRATLVRDDGYLIDMSEWNAAAEKDSPITRPNPPLSVAQLQSVVTAKEWQRTLQAIPKDPKGMKPGGTPGQTEAPPAADNAKISATLAGLLPKGFKVTDRGGDGEWAYLVVDDGDGKSYVQVNVQPGMDDVAGELFKDAETTPDGTTLFTTRQGPGDKGIEGVQMWTADTLRQDGLRVVVSAFNAADQKSAPSRETPALNLRALVEIATSKAWLKVGA